MMSNDDIIRRAKELAAETRHYMYDNQNDRSLNTIAELLALLIEVELETQKKLDNVKSTTQWGPKI
jgi:hypothetical protein